MLQTQEKAAYTAMEVAGMVGLSTPRFYQLIKRGIFPPAERLGGGRPIYPKHLAECCSIIREVGIGWNGEPVTFNVKHKEAARAALALQTQHVDV